MRKIISLLVALCVLAACSFAGAEGKAPEGKPWINSNLLDSIPAERPVPEAGFDLYANYDAYREAKDKGITEGLLSLDGSERIAREQILDLYRSTETECAEDEILRILYGLVTDTEKRDADGLAPLMAKVDRVKAVETTDDLLALMQEEGFLPCDTFFNISLQQAQGDPGRVVVSVMRDSLSGGAEPETLKAALLRMQYSKEEAAALAERMKEYDEYTPDGSVLWPQETGLTIGQLKEKSPLLYAQITGLGLVKDGPIYDVFSDYVEATNHFFTAEDLDLLKAIVALRLYWFSADYMEKVNDMIGKMDQIEVLDSVMLKGQVTISELMSDVTGVSLSLDLAKKTEDFNYTEFFETYAAPSVRCIRAGKSYSETL